LPAHLEGALLDGAHLEGADLRDVWLDSKTVLSNATLDDKTRLADAHWSGVGSVDLTSMTWDRVPTLGDERGVGIGADLEEHEEVVRACRQVSAQLRAQGMSEVADRFLYRAQVRQRAVLLRRGRIGSWLFSLLLWALSGYGYRLGRIIATYLIVLVAFAAAYYFVGDWFGEPHLEPYEALLMSFTNIHGRAFTGIFDFRVVPVRAWLAGLQALLGLVIEGVFVAMLVQRFFAR